jgi:hypothetical protein
MVTEKTFNQGYFILGTQTGKCPLCKETKKLLILKFDTSLCEDCFCVCMGILEHLLDDEINSPNIPTPFVSKTLSSSVFLEKKKTEVKQC